jgi:DNA-binding transcriptional LysR family regulator
VHDAFESLRAVRGRPGGTLRINVPRFAYANIIAPRLAAFWTAYPEIKLEVVIEDALTNIVERGFDAGMRIGEFIDRDMISVRVTGEWRMAIVGSPAYFATHPKPKHPRDCAAHDCINYRLTGGGVYRWEFVENGKDFAVAVDGRLLVNDGDFMVDAVLRGFGLAYIIEEQVIPLIKEKRLVRVLESYCEPFPGLSLYYPTRVQIAPKLQAFVDFFRYTPRRKMAP